MNEVLARPLEAFDRLHVVVLGEAMLDTYLEGESRGLCPEAPVPVVAVSQRHDAPGGAANTAVNARSLGARVSFLSVAGDDAEGAALRRALGARDVPAEHLLTQPGRRTLAKQRVVAASQILVRFDQGDTAAADPDTEKALADRLAALWPECDAVIISDYGYGVLTPGVIATLAVLQARRPRVVVADSKRRLATFREVGVTAVKPNYGEALRVLRVPPAGPGSGRVEVLAAHGQQLLGRTGARIAAVTLDTEGALVFERGRPPYRTYARPNPHSRAAGAGDTYVSALALALAAGADTPVAAELASAAAGVVVGKDRTASCSARELRAFLTADDKRAADRRDLALRLEEYRRRGRRIVFTNGCFDILHRGHVTYLSRAKALGDVLVVGVNTDESIRRLKGPDRPINPLADRLEVLAALSCVDQLIPFDEDTPHRLIEVVRPDVFVKGGDYTRDRLPEAALVERLGGVVTILPLVEDRSTTRMIDRIRAWGGSPEPSGNGCDGVPRPSQAPQERRPTNQPSRTAQESRPTHQPSHP